MSELPWTRLEPTRPRLTRRAVVQALVGVMLYLGGANAAAGWVVVLSAAVIGAVPWAWASVWRSGRRVEARRWLPAHAVGGIAVTSRLEVRAPSGAFAIIRDELTGAVGAAGRLRQGAEVATEAQLRRGAIRGAVVEVRLSDLFGLVRVTAAGDVPATCDVLPAAPELGAGSWLTDWAAQDAGAATRAGHGTEVLGVREYRHGDPPRVIHWRSTARQGRLVARELATEARPRTRIDVGGGTWEQSALDRAAEVACGLAEAVHAGGHPVQVALDGTVVDWGPHARRHLGMLPPHAGAPPRALAPTPPSSDADILVMLSPEQDGVAVSLATAGDERALGTLPSGATLEEVSAWLVVRTRLSGA